MKTQFRNRFYTRPLWTTGGSQLKARKETFHLKGQQLVASKIYTNQVFTKSGLSETLSSYLHSRFSTLQVQICIVVISTVKLLNSGLLSIFVEYLDCLLGFQRLYQFRIGFPKKDSSPFLSHPFPYIPQTSIRFNSAFASCRAFSK